jgi:hypothetical protein
MHGVLQRSFVTVLALTLIMLNGCGAIFTGSTTTVPVSTTPAGALVSSNPPSGQMVTPMSIVLDKAHDYVLKFEKEGYEPATIMINKKINAGIVVLDVLFTGLIGVVVDALTNGWYSHTPKSVDVTLRKSGDSGASSEEIRIHGEISGSEVRLESSSPVYVSVEKRR